jgi:putative ATP-binding cassette transporter
LDEKLEAEIYRILRQKLATTTIISIGHRATLLDYHERHLEMTLGGDGLFSPQDRGVA